MRVPRIYQPQPLQPGTSIALTATAVQHLLKALRLQSGDAVILFNGDGSDYHGQLQAGGKKHASVRVDSVHPVNAESPVAVHIGLGMSLGDRMEYAIQKATETGVTELTPLETTRSELRLRGERAEKKQQRWQQVAISAAEQCGRAVVPVVHPVQTLPQWLASVPQDTLRLVLHHESARALGEFDKPAEVWALVGPEGGLDAQDIDQAVVSGFVPCVLGPRILRTETAPVVLLSALQTLWGDY